MLGHAPASLHPTYTFFQGKHRFGGFELLGYTPASLHPTYTFFQVKHRFGRLNC